MAAFTEIAAEVYLLRCPVLDVNSTLVVGGEVAVVVDTLSTDAQAVELLEAVRRVTPLPLILVNTHAHFDHCYGNGVLADDSPGGGIWAHEAAATALRERGDTLQREWYREWLPTDPELAEGLAAVAVRVPNRTVHSESTMDIGGRLLELRHLGRGHTDGDLYVYLPKEKVVMTGDALVDWMPFVNDGYPEEWVTTLTAVEKLDFTHIIPGHGEVMTKSGLAFFRGYISDLVAAVKKAAADGASLDDMKTKIAEQLAPKYEAGMSKYPLGKYRASIATNIEMVHKKVVTKA